MTKLTASQRQKLIQASTIQCVAAKVSTPKKMAAKRPHTPYSSPSATTAKTIANNDFIFFPGLLVEFLFFQFLFSFRQAQEETLDNRLFLLGGAVVAHDERVMLIIDLARTCANCLRNSVIACLCSPADTITSIFDRASSAMEADLSSSVVLVLIGTTTHRAVRQTPPT
jgi:hypothetical protein